MNPFIVRAAEEAFIKSLQFGFRLKLKSYYSSVPNKRGVLNKWGGWKIYQKLINGVAPINGVGGKWDLV